jgi:uncharacterized membrane protein
MEGTGMNATHLVEGFLLPLATTVRLMLECLSVLTVLTGLVMILRQALQAARRGMPPRPSNRARLTFGTWLALALEFQLGADIVSTVTSPSEQNLIQLGAIAVIRTLLNVFLGREIEAEMRMEEQRERLG